jgi:hypothetical protein
LTSQACFADVVRRANLQSLKAMRLHAEVAEPDKLTDCALVAEISEHPEWELHEDRSRLDVRVSFSITLAPSGEASSAKFNADATYELVYVFDEPLSDDDPKLEEALGLFAAKNSRFNAWPFLREYVNYAATYAGLPSVMLPLLKPYANLPKEGMRDEPPQEG